MAACPSWVLPFIRERWVHPGPRSSSGRVTSFGAELAQAGSSWLMVAPGLSSLTEILALSHQQLTQQRDRSGFQDAGMMEEAV